jgi:hypothetical protein
MSKLLDELLGRSEDPKEPRKFVFFNDNDVEGYTSQADFLASLRRQKKVKPYWVDNLKIVIDNMALGRSLSSEPSLSKDDGHEIVWCRFTYGKTRQNLQILNECGMFEFVKDYATGRIQNVPSFDDLIKSINVE